MTEGSTDHDLTTPLLIQISNHSTQNIETIDPSLFNNESIAQVVAKEKYLFIVPVNSNKIYIICCDSNNSNNDDPFVGGIYVQPGVHTVIQVREEEQVLKITVTSVATFLVCKSGNIYSMGLNVSCCMGLGEEFSDSPRFSQPHLIPRKLLHYEPCIDIECATLSTRFVTRSNDGSHNLYSCGSNSYGECALGGTIPVVVPTPTKINSVAIRAERIKKIVSSSHAFMMLTDSGRLFVNGLNINNQLFLGSFKFVTQLTEIKRRVRDIAARQNGFAIITEQMKLFSSQSAAPYFGPGLSSQEMEFSTVTPEPIAALYAGASNFVAITTNNRVFSRTKHSKTLQPISLWSANCMIDHRQSCSIGSMLTAYYLTSTCYSPVKLAFPRLGKRLGSDNFCDITLILQN